MKSNQPSACHEADVRRSEVQVRSHSHSHTHAHTHTPLTSHSPRGACGWATGVLDWNLGAGTFGAAWASETIQWPLE